MTNTVKHTPAPWEAVEHTAINNVKGYRIFSGDNEVAVCRNTVGGIVTFTRLPAKANAAFICRAVNCHDELIEALELAIQHYVGTGRNSKNVVGEAGVAADKINAVIAKARGQS